MVRVFSFRTLRRYSILRKAVSNSNEDDRDVGVDGGGLPVARPIAGEADPVGEVSPRLSAWRTPRPDLTAVSEDLEGEFAARLRAAIDAAGLTARRFALLMDESGVTGSGYSTVYRYLKGEAEPPRDFLSAAAELLKVRAAWLAFGDGEMLQVPLVWDAAGDVVRATIEQRLAPMLLSAGARYGMTVGAVETLALELIDAREDDLGDMLGDAEFFGSDGEVLQEWATTALREMGEWAATAVLTAITAVPYKYAETTVTTMAAFQIARALAEVVSAHRNSAEHRGLPTGVPGLREARYDEQ